MDGEHSQDENKSGDSSEIDAEAHEEEKKKREDDISRR